MVYSKKSKLSFLRFLVRTPLFLYLSPRCVRRATEKAQDSMGAIHLKSMEFRFITQLQRHRATWLLHYSLLNCVH